MTFGALYLIIVYIFVAAAFGQYINVRVKFVNFYQVPAATLVGIIWPVSLLVYLGMRAGNAFAKRKFLT